MTATQGKSARPKRGAATKKTSSSAVAARGGGTGGAEPAPLAFESPSEWWAWLDRHHASSPGVWLTLAKKGNAAPSITYAEALEGALAYGWIDGQKRALDDRWWLQRFTRRGPKSIWSKINREKATALIDAGRMHASGLAAVEQAKRDGRWDAAYDGQRSATVPDDLAAALASNARAAAFFATLDAANRYAILFRLHHAKRPETRARQLARFVAMLARREKIHP